MKTVLHKPDGTILLLNKELGGAGGGPHTHPISDVLLLQAGLDAKAATVHTHAQADVTGLVSDLAGKASSSHTHAQSGVINLVTDLATLSSGIAGKASTVHTHVISDVTNLQTSLDGKSATGHGHAESDVTNLVSDLAAKAPGTRSIATQHSLTGGGNLTADRTLSLVSDSATPGNNKVYGTDGAGAKGWKSDPAGAVNIKQTEIDFGATPVSEASFTVTDSEVSAGSQLIGFVAYEAPTGKDLDELEMDAIDLKFAPGSGEFTVYARGMDGDIADKFKINYLIG